MAATHCNRKIRALQGARANVDWMRWPLVHLIMGTGREEVMRKGGIEEARSGRAVCDVCDIWRQGYR